MSNFENSSLTPSTDVNEILFFIPFQEVFSFKGHKYTKIRQIGVGGFGKVNLCKRDNDGLQFCLKVIEIANPENSNTSELAFHGMTISYLENEVNLLKNLNHPNIVKYIEHFTQEENFIIVMEYVEGKSLRDVINDQKSLNEVFSEDFICQVLSQLISALSYCHSQKIIHRDIKPENILITKENLIKLIDFGLSKQIESFSISLESNVGTFIYKSPEMIKGGKYLISTDVWSLGCVIYELMALKHPFFDNPADFIKIISQRKKPNYNSLKYSPELKHQVKNMLCYNPQKRCSLFLNPNYILTPLSSEFNNSRVQSPTNHLGKQNLITEYDHQQLKVQMLNSDFNSLISNPHFQKFIINLHEKEITSIKLNLSELIQINFKSIENLNKLLFDAKGTFDKLLFLFQNSCNEFLKFNQGQKNLIRKWENISINYDFSLLAENKPFQLLADQKIIIVSPIISGPFNDCFSKCSLLKAVVFSLYFRSLGNSCFSECSSLVSIYLPSSLSSIGDNCFLDCKSLNEIKIPSSIQSLGKGCFSGCSSLQEIVLPLSSQSLGERFFFGCSALKKISLPLSLKSLDDSCFFGCKSLNEIKLPSSIKSLGDSCFFGCKSLNEINLPLSLEVLSNSCFEKCQSLKTINFESSLVLSIGNSCFSKCLKLQTINLKLLSNLKSLGDLCFSSSSNLSTITLPSSLQSIGDSCFSSCSSLSTITLPLSLQSLGDLCFSSCSKLTTISIPSSLKSLGDSCFSFCSNLTNITLPSELPFLGKSCFIKCSRLKEINIPSKLISLGDKCFSECLALTTISLPSSLHSLGKFCFSKCSSLIEIKLPSSLLSIGDFCFQNCIALKSIELPPKLESLGVKCFANCSSLALINCISSLKFVGDKCFYKCIKFPARFKEYYKDLIF